MKNAYFMGFKCHSCGKEYSPDKPWLLCEACGGLLDAIYDYKAFRKNISIAELRERTADIWRWKELMPVLDFSKIVTLGEGYSPILSCPRLAKKIGIKELFILADSISSPTGSLKDRSIAVSATKAVEFGYEVLSCDSTGNKASSVAGYAARAGLKSVVFCPEQTPKPKLAQSTFFGAKVIKVKGHYSQINAIYRQLIHSGKVRWYDCGTDNPFRYEGKKSYAYEIAEELSWKAPDRVIQPAAGGMSIVKTWKAFKELLGMGLIDRLPKMTAAQSEKCAPITEAFLRGDKKATEVKKGNTIATAIAVASPGLLGDWTLETLYESGGCAGSATDEQLIEATKWLAEEGIFVEPSAASSLASLKNLVDTGKVNKDERVVCVVTGSGFKDFDQILALIEDNSPIVDCDFDAILEISKSL